MLGPALSMAVATAGLQSTGTRRAVVRSEKFVEWQREISSSRSVYGGRKRHEEIDNMESNGMKKYTSKNDEEYVKNQDEECYGEREVDGDERTADSNLGDANGATARTKLRRHQHHSQRSERRKNRKEHEVDQKKMVSVQNEEKSSAPADGEVERTRRWKQLPPPSQATPGKRQSQLSPEEDNGQSIQREQVLNPNLPIRRRPRRTLIGSYEENETERVLRSLSRIRVSEIPPPPPGAPPGKKRSKRVAQRLANEEPPPPPLKLPKLQVVLTKKEIHDDWLKITGHKYTGKPKKSTMTAMGLNLCTSLTCPSSIRYLSEPQ